MEGAVECFQCWDAWLACQVQSLAPHDFLSTAIKHSLQNQQQKERDIFKDFYCKGAEQICYENRKINIFDYKAVVFMNYRKPCTKKMFR